jgi:hypothetical protein
MSNVVYSMNQQFNYLPNHNNKVIMVILTRLCIWHLGIMKSPKLKLKFEKKLFNDFWTSSGIAKQEKKVTFTTQKVVTHDTCVR